MRRDLLWANSFEEGLHVVEVAEDHRVPLSVVRVDIPLPHVLQVLLVEGLSILFLVHWLNPKSSLMEGSGTASW